MSIVECFVIGCVFFGLVLKQNSKTHRRFSKLLAPSLKSVEIMYLSLQ